MFTREGADIKQWDGVKANQQIDLFLNYPRENRIHPLERESRGLWTGAGDTRHSGRTEDLAKIELWAGDWR